METKDFTAFIHWLEDVPMYGHKDGTNNIRKLMKRMGDPQKKAKIVHVAGTNGKGSTCAMVASVLRESGLKVGLYTSPHLVTYTERIQVNGVNIPEGEMTRLGWLVKEEIGKMVAEGENHCTFFEILTAIGFLYFAEQKVDAIVLEVGVGGRMDATNIVEDPAVCIIASISLDHTKVLGDTLEAIAGEKAGILKPGRPVVLSENPLCVQEVVKARADEVGCPYVYAPSLDLGAENYRIPLVGDYQRQNKQTALAALRILKKQGFPITEETLKEGLRKTAWPGRMQSMELDGQPLLLDGAHNPGGAGMLAAYLERNYPKESITLVFSALGKKDLSGILLPLRNCGAIKQAIFTCIHEEDNLDHFIQYWEEGQGSKPYRINKVPMEAVKEAAAEKPPLVVIAGSLYLIGEIGQSLPLT